MTRGRARWTVAAVRRLVADYEYRMVGGVKAKYLIVGRSGARSAQKVADQVGLKLEVSRRIAPDAAYICGVIPNTGAAYLLSRKRR